MGTDVAEAVGTVTNTRSFKAHSHLGILAAHNQSAEVEPRIRYRQYEVESNILRRAVPPEEFRCPMSSRMMYDPVVIASGQSCERMWIQKWFDEGHDTCPKTNMKLTNMSLTPNVSMKDLISRWCTQNEVMLTDPSTAPEALRSWEISSTSIASFGSSMNDLRLQMDFSNISLGSIDASFSSDSSRTKTTNGLSSVQTDDGSERFQSCPNISETDLEFLSNLGELSWESRCKVVDDVNNHLKCNDKAYHSPSPENFVKPLIAFLTDARDSKDVNAQRDGFQLLLAFVSKNRNKIPYLREDAFGLLASFLDSEVAEEAFVIMESLSVYPYCRSKIMASGALQRLGPLLLTLTDALVLLLKYLKVAVSEEQEYAVDILLSLCSQRVEYCQLVMEEGIIPPLVNISINGSDRGKVNALELLRQLRDIRSEPEFPPFEVDADRGLSNQTNERKSSKASGFFGRKISMFSKSSGKRR
ncbi:Coatomer beta subunit [Trema orientale]|uniref:RING-type E3 ubiquitin transferase n=1 Tax=Trema orientale TaxID=63057 RepID=A0A2P5FXK1_TREOI|nr:Coatomer beta subunit [Trema orientale]